MSAPVVAIGAAGGGYVLAATDGSLYPFDGSAEGATPPTGTTVVGLAATMAGTSSVAASAPGFTDGFAALAGPWPEGTTHGAWAAAFTGYGTVGVGSDGGPVLVASPAPSVSPGVTHAALVTSIPAFGDQDLRIRVRTVKQLRVPAPNPWEVGWVLWHVGDRQHFYALVLKPTGWELDKEDPAYPGAQRFLASGTSPLFPVGTWHEVRVVQVGAAMTAWVDGALLTQFTDTERPYTTGAIGLYTEDAEAQFAAVSVTAP